MPPVAKRPLANPPKSEDEARRKRLKRVLGKPSSQRTSKILAKPRANARESAANTTLEPLKNPSASTLESVDRIHNAYIESLAANQEELDRKSVV